MSDAPSGPAAEPLVETLRLEPIEVNLFRGQPSRSDGPRIFGGHVIAQAILAAYATVEGRVCHSAHAYFIRPGDPRTPILYEVDRARDGSSFTTRRVTAVQNGRQIFNLAASFQLEEGGFDHQSDPPDTPTPESLPDRIEQLRAADLEALSPAMRAALERPRPIEQRLADPRGPDEAAPAAARIWMRARDPVGSDVALQQAILAYASDMGLLETAMRPHGVTWTSRGLQSASLDHALWFHRPTDFHAWHLYAQDSPSASGARGFIRGQIFDRAGRLVASVAQEGLIRQHPV